MRLQNYNFFLIYTNFSEFFLLKSEKKRNFAPDFESRNVIEGKIPAKKAHHPTKLALLNRSLIERRFAYNCEN